MTSWDRCDERDCHDLGGIQKELDELEDTISTIKAVLLDAEEEQVHNHQIRNWLNRPGGAVHEADDLSDEINTEALQIYNCPNLLKKCQRLIGEDWPKIAHIEILDFFQEIFRQELFFPRCFCN
ncbi:hypothetical protein TIFTF001_008335 [Ficus carica]|uniref:Disease resistance N-terminal domain-containing protein n=1 Tax=Ficus carica TaxID=3494 RepID=A0AA88D2R4_FICCA|nr:hypothetical protein TIFTF001_008335 [Ficus carica]